LFCWKCPQLTKIPDTLVNLIRLSCEGCPLLVELSETLVNLEVLECDFITLEEHLHRIHLRNLKSCSSEWMRMVEATPLRSITREAKEIK
jgi:hypothetical protein